VSISSAERDLRAYLDTMDLVEAQVGWRLAWDLLQAPLVDGDALADRLVDHVAALRLNLGLDANAWRRVMHAQTAIVRVFAGNSADAEQTAHVMGRLARYFADRPLTAEAIAVPCPQCAGRRGVRDRLGYVERRNAGRVFCGHAAVRAGADPIVWPLELEPGRVVAVTCPRGHEVSLSLDDLAWTAAAPTPY
jgi:hypothetical protein